MKKENKKLVIHPFVKWVGGKTQLLDEICKRMPKKYNRYFEPFVGGGALLFKVQPKEFLINDKNSELIKAYGCFKDGKEFDLLKKQLEKRELAHSEQYFKKVRDEDRNKDFEKSGVVDHASRMIYLNKACFNGLYRVNKKGYFNVPSNKKKVVRCYDRNNFEEIRSYFKNSKSKVLNTDFETALKGAKPGDFVYLDPPYDKLDGKQSFTSYGKESFDKQDQERVAKVFKELDSKGVKVMLSNHNTQYIRDLYKDYKIDVINAKRMVSCKVGGRSGVEEVLITNY